MKDDLLKKLIIIFVACAFLFGCSSDIRKEERVIKKLRDISSYSCNAIVKVRNNKSVMKYELKHYYKKNSGFRIEVTKPEELKGQILLYKANEFLSYNPVTGYTLAIDDSNEKFGFHMLLGTFLPYYSQLNVAEIKGEKYKDIDCYTYQLTLNNSNAYMNQVKLFINKENNLPVKMDIYDKEGNKTTEVEYSDFVLNAEMNKEMFELNKSIDNKTGINK